MIKFLIKLFVFILLFSTIFSLLILLCANNNSNADTTYYGLYIVYNLQSSILLSLSTATMFLTLIKIIRNSLFLSFLAFYLLPLLILNLEFYPVTNNIAKMKTMFFPIILPFFTFLTISYILFLKRVKNCLS